MKPSRAKSLKIVSWNVNGLRAIHKKGFLDWMISEDADIVCIQESKATEDQVPEEIKQIKGYHCHFESAQRKGYSGVAIWTREKPKRIKTQLGISRFDVEGRVIQAEYDKFTLFNVYFPNGGASPERLKFKLDFYDSFLYHIMSLRQRRIVVCGDVNTAHREIDLARPKENRANTGFLPEERAWLDSLVSRGFVDTFRHFNQEPGHYTWWDYKTRARERNVGWRIDYFFVSRALKKYLKGAFIRPAVMGSDHCPLGIEIELS
ncbi:exodeoxyribonuclease III [Candidatus Eisenbacteria bacterium]|uniref:Exodeoxyribonuclease III n=1 Tax=Eiseniibacteriota bacterium TaxID=2212470 RepID=A0ABV6YQL9_UNCEI